MADGKMCAVWCDQCSSGDAQACRKASSQCEKSCPPWLKSMGQAFDDPLESTLESFVGDKSYWGDDGEKEADRDSRTLAYAGSKGSGREKLVPNQFANYADTWGGGLRRMTAGGVGPRREDELVNGAPRYVPVGFARYVDPTVDPGDYTYHLLSGWRVAVPRTVPGPAARALLLRIYQYGPQSAGYARLGDTLVPAILGPGDRQTLAESESRLGPVSRKWPLA